MDLLALQVLTSSRAENLTGDMVVEWAALEYQAPGRDVDYFSVPLVEIPWEPLQPTRWEVDLIWWDDHESGQEREIFNPEDWSDIDVDDGGRDSDVDYGAYYWES